MPMSSCQTGVLGGLSFCQLCVAIALGGLAYGLKEVYGELDWLYVPYWVACSGVLPFISGVLATVTERPCFVVLYSLSSLICMLLCGAYAVLFSVKITVYFLLSDLLLQCENPTMSDLKCVCGDTTILAGIQSCSEIPSLITLARATLAVDVILGLVCLIGVTLGCTYSICPRAKVFKPVITITTLEENDNVDDSGQRDFGMNPVSTNPQLVYTVEQQYKKHKKAERKGILTNSVPKQSRHFYP